MTWKSQAFEPVSWVAGKLSRSGPDPRIVEPRSILVLRSTDLGDLLTTTPIFEALRRRFPRAHLVAGIGSWARAIVENNPFVDEIAEIDLPWSNKFVADKSPAALLTFLARSPQITALRKRGGFDVGIEILGSHITALTLLRLGARYRVGLRGYRGGWSACQQSATWKDGPHVCAMALRQAELLGAKNLPEARPQLYLVAAEREAAQSIWAPGSPRRPLRLLINCGGGLPVKVWPVEPLTRALADLSATMERQIGRPNMLLIGGSADRERAEQVMAARIPGLRSVCGEVPLRTTFALTEQADLVLTNASMLLHVAAAFRRPTVTVLGGMHADIGDHDRAWGYPPPYSSVGVTEPGTWPSPERVVNSVLSAINATAVAA